ncbi:MAG: hypothetical protein AB7P23_08610 [Amphiplicatus sp.]
MELVMDFLLLAASGTACFYCLVLTRRLKDLTNAKAGLGAGVAALSKSAEEVKSAVEGTKKSADNAAARLEGLIAKADEKVVRLNELMDHLADMGASVVNHAEGATKKYVDGLAPFIEDANNAAESLLEAIECASASSNALPGGAGALRKSARARAVDEESDLEFVVVEDSAEAGAAGRRRKRSGAAA